VLGHADFSRNNLLFRRSQDQVGMQIVERAASHAQQIARAIEEHGAARVEAVLDAALALEQHVDVDQPLVRPPYPEYAPPQPTCPDDDFRRRFAALDPDSSEHPHGMRRRAPVPPFPERDLLWFIANYAPELEGWERDVFLAVREESYYFYPVFATQIMNEGWASYWHARLLRESDFLPQETYLDAIKCHSDVVRPIAADQQVALAVNPYHLGFSIWEKVVERDGLEAARRVMREEDDFSFVRNRLTPELADELGLFRFEADSTGGVRVIERDLPKLQDALLAPKYNFGAPRVAALHVHVDGTLELQHDHATDGRGLDPERSRRVLEYLKRVWRRPVKLHTVGAAGQPLELVPP
ncbi:MAG: SpoVR family protein, partial [Pseudomonadota bacterium]